MFSTTCKELRRRRPMNNGVNGVQRILKEPEKRVVLTARRARTQQGTYGECQVLELDAGEPSRSRFSCDRLTR
jgi:hypothetical protein